MIGLYTADEVAKKISEWKADGRSKDYIIQRTSYSCLGWPYVWGAAGQYCTKSYRQQFASRGSCPEGEKRLILNQCQICNGKKSSCDGCKWYPGGKTRIFDCRGFTRWVLAQVGITLKGAGATSQWNTNDNWAAKGEISSLPNQVCVLFWKDKKKAGVMAHTGLYLGDGKIVHCSGTVKEDTTATKGWTHWAVPKGLEGGDLPVWRSTIRKGSKGDDVIYCQERLKALGFYPGTIDGKFGSKTKAAVEAFQRANGLGVDGVVGPLTWEKLESDKPPEVKYSVTIYGLDYTQATAIHNNYPGSEIKEMIG